MTEKQTPAEKREEALQKRNERVERQRQEAEAKRQRNDRAKNVAEENRFRSGGRWGR